MFTRFDPARVARRRAVLPALALFAALAQGCVTTEALYAEYDERACRVAVETVASGATLVREIGTDRTMHWEPLVDFALDGDALAPGERARLDRDVAVLLAFPELRVIVRGFADAVGTRAYNRDLAARRVAAVTAYLRERGIGGDRLDEVPFGEGLPLVRVDDEEAVPVNRRVELLLTDARGLPVPLRVRPLDRPGASR